MSLAKIAVVSFAPADEDGGVGGFEWAPLVDYPKMEEFYVDLVRDSVRELGTHVVRLLIVDVPSDLSPGAVTDRLDDHVDVLEVTGQAVRQYVPPTINPDWLPKGDGRRTLKVVIR